MSEMTCVDVGTDVATSQRCSGNISFSVFFYLCTCFMLLLYNMLEHVCMHLYVATDAATSFYYERSQNLSIFLMYMFSANI